MKPEQMTTSQLWSELDRIGRKRAPLTGATMMRRNEIATELRTRMEIAA